MAPTTASDRRRAAIAPGAITTGPGSRQAVLALGMAALALGFLANSAAGPLLIDAVDYPVSESMRNQTIGLDAAALLLLAPTSIVAATLAWRGHRLAPVLAVSIGSYAAYIFVQYLVAPEFDHYPATLLLHLGMFIGGWTLAVHGWTVARRQLDPLPARSARHALAPVIMGGFVILRYLPGLAASLTQDPLPDEVSGDLTMYWLIVVSDLGIFIPIAIATAIGIRRGTPWARLALLAIAGWFTVVSVAVTAMSLTMVLADDPYASRAQLGLFVITTAAVAGYAVRLHRDVVRETEPIGTEPAAPSGEPPP